MSHASRTLAYSDPLLALYRADARRAVPLLLEEDPPATVVLDPPYDAPDLWAWSAEVFAAVPTRLVFCDPRSLGEVVGLFGPCSWVFTWDTLSPWNLGPRRPLTQTRFALLYGDLDSYDRDAALHGDAPPARDHPTTRSTPLDGRRLVDLHRASLRWLHHPEAGARPGESEGQRFARRSSEAYRHAKPIEWVRCLLGNTTPTGATVGDPFAGSGTTLVAARSLGLSAWGVELDPDTATTAAARLSGPALDEDSGPQLSLFGA